MNSSTSSDKAQISEQLLNAIQTEQLEKAAEIINFLVPEEIAEILEATPPDQRAILWDCIDSEKQGEVLAHANEAIRASILDTLETHEIVEIAVDLQTDDIADIVQSLPEQEQQDFIEALPEENRNAVQIALAYDENTAGGIMSSDFVAVRADISLGVVLRYLRQRGELPHSTSSLFVWDREENLIGTIQLTDLLIHDEDLLVEEILKTDIQGINVYTSSKEVAHIFQKNDLISAPVVNDQNQLIGRITIDDVVDIIRDEAEHTQMASAGLDEDDDIFAPAQKSAKRRTFWLGINLLTAIFASIVIGLFDAAIEKVVALAILMPIIASMGGIAGTQTATIVIRALATGKLAKSNSRSLLIKETTVGLFNGVIWATLTGIAVFAIFHDWQLSAIFSTAILINLLAAAFAGAMIPLILQRLKIDPALASGLMLTTVTDSVGFFVFLGLATMVLL